MADSDQSIYNLRYNQVSQSVEGFGGGSPMWTPLVISGGGTPMGPDMAIQYNSSGAFAGDPNFLWDSVDTILKLSGNALIQNGNDANTSIQFLNGQGLTILTSNSILVNTPVGINSTLMLTAGGNDSDIRLYNGSGIGYAVELDGDSATPFLALNRIDVNRGPGLNITDNGTEGQLGMGTQTPDASAILDLTSTTLGALLPRMTTVQKTAIATPAEGLMVYDLTLHKLSLWTGSAWETVTSA